MNVVGIVLGAAAFVTAIGVIWKMVCKPILVWGKRVNNGMDSLLGYGPVTDPGTGKQLQAPTPPMAQRVADLEDAVTRMIDLQEKQQGFNERLLELELWRKEHMQFSEDKWKEMQQDQIEWRKEHEAMHLLAHETGVEVAKKLP